MTERAKKVLFIAFGVGFIAFCVWYAFAPLW